MVAQRYEKSKSKNASIHDLYLNIYHNFKVYITNEDVHNKISENQNNKKKIIK